uniref:Uncharacterized protein n=1 Tax=Arundo donax TaxID=35708 RepID=A0A0A8XPN0_ARUDO
MLSADIPVYDSTHLPSRSPPMASKSSSYSSPVGDHRACEIWWQARSGPSGGRSLRPPLALLVACLFTLAVALLPPSLAVSLGWGRRYRIVWRARQPRLRSTTTASSTRKGSG